MRARLSHLLALLSLAFVMSPALSIADEGDISARGRAMLAKREFYVVTAAERTAVYVEPDAKSKVIWTANWINQLLVDRTRLAMAPRGWIPIAANGDHPPSWVERGDVVIGDRMKKVVDCWPIKSMRFEMGDYSAGIDFKRDGSGILWESGDDPKARRIPDDKVRIFMEGSVAQVVRLRTGRGDTFVPMGYREETQLLYPLGLPPAEQIKFDPPVLEGCKSVPELQK